MCPICKELSLSHSAWARVCNNFIFAAKIQIGSEQNSPADCGPNQMSGFQFCHFASKLKSVHAFLFQRLGPWFLQLWDEVIQMLCHHQ